MGVMDEKYLHQVGKEILVEEMIFPLQGLGLQLGHPVQLGVDYDDPQDMDHEVMGPLDEASLKEIVTQLHHMEEAEVSFIKGFSTSHDPMEGTMVTKLRQSFLREFDGTVFGQSTPTN